MWMLVCLILSIKCLKLSSIFWLIFFFLVLRSGDFHYSVFLFLLLNINVFIFIGGWLLYSAVVVLPHIDMNPLRVHMCSPSWGPAHPLPAPPSGLARCTSRHCSVCQLTDLSSESSNLLTHLLYFSCQLLYSSIIISSVLYLLPLCAILTPFCHASPDRSKCLLFVYLLGPLGLAVSLAFSSCIEWGLPSVLVHGLPIVLASLVVEHRL